MPDPIITPALWAVSFVLAAAGAFALAAGGMCAEEFHRREALDLDPEPQRARAIAGILGGVALILAALLVRP